MGVKRRQGSYDQKDLFDEALKASLRHGVTVLNAPGTIDCDYRGELKVILVNHSGQVQSVARGARVAQLVIAPVARVAVDEVDDLGETARGQGGFGSTGT